MDLDRSLHLMDERYKTFQVNVAGQVLTIETARMVALMDALERWLARCWHRWR